MAKPSPATEWTIPVGERTTRALVDAATAPAPGGRRTVFLCAHGAGGNLQDNGVRSISRALTPRGIDVVRFNFLYRERGSSRPDQMPLLEATIEAVAARAREELAPDLLLLGGRSMGGRAASMLASRDASACDGLFLLAYPLHPPGRQEQLRDAHLPAIQVPVLCINGTRDAFMEPELMEGVLKRLGSNWRMHWVEGADHGFHVPKSSGRTDADVMTEIGEQAEAWVGKIA